LSALDRLGLAGRSRRVPYVAAQSATECGAACLAMVLGLHGRSVRLDEVRESLDAARDGLDASQIVAAAGAHGLRGRGVRCEPEDLAYLPPGSVLHWEFQHFVVLERAGRAGADIVDPALGRRRVTMAELRRAFTGVALTFEPGEDFEPRPPGTSPLVPYFRRVLGSSGGLGRILVTSLLLRVFALALPLLTGLLVDRVVPHADQSLLLVAGLGVAAILGFAFLGNLVRSYLLLELRARLDSRLMLDFLEHLLALPFPFLQRRSTGDLAMRLDSNAVLREVLTSSALVALLDGSLVLLYLVALVFLSPTLGSLVLALAALQVGLFALNRRAYRSLMSEELQASSRLQGYEIEMLGGIETLKAAGAEGRALDRWSNLFVDALNVTVRRDRRAAVVDALMDLLSLGSPLVVLWVGAFEVLAGRLTLGGMLALGALATGVLAPLAGLVATALRLETAASYAERLEDVLCAPRERQTAGLRPKGRLRGRIVLEGVTFAYGDQAEPVLRDVSLAVEPGQHVAVVGRSGSGKSTLARLLLGLYVPTSGRILVDGVDLNDLDLAWFRRQVGFVPQRPHLFAGSLRSNLAFGAHAADLPAIERAARLACIEDEIGAMPMGFETIVIDQGASLSGGQHQRLALARALVHDPAVLILDEATSALDSLTERAVQSNLEGLACTRVVIAQRLSTIEAADVIFVLEGGRLVEQGRHDQLMAARGRYEGLVRAQTEGRIAGLRGSS
jgi:ABC-type bacteriocin/lantibiotic exporter with double-glycine peptidase domain